MTLHEPQDEMKGDRSITTILAAAAFAAAISGCDKLYPVDVGVSTGQGVVRRVDYPHHMITLDHKRIPNLLEAMTFAYPVRSDSMMNGVRVGDTVSFTIDESSPGQFRVESITPPVPIRKKKG